MKLFVPFILAACAISAGAAPIQWTSGSGGNDHWYDIIAAPNPQSPDYWTWSLAVADATARGGYLATLTSAGEDAFVFTNLANNPAYWFLDGAGNEEGPRFGLSNPDIGHTYDWTWVTGENYIYQNWAAGEPNNLTTEDSAVFFDNFLPNVNGNRPPVDQWNNVPKSSGMYAYVIEYDHAPATTPEPGTFMMLAGGGLLALAGRRKFVR
jgi:hypothetical protein